MSNTVQHDNMERLDNPIVSANPQTHVEGSTTTLFNRDSRQIRLIHKPECRPFWHTSWGDLHCGRY